MQTTVQDESLIARRHRTLGARSPLFYDRPLHLVRGEGVWVYDAEGKRYLDAYNNVAHVGHCHPHVVEALGRQAAKLNVSTRYLDATVVEYAERLLAKFESPLARVMFTCTGSEANELALRIARECTGGAGIIVTDHAYYGNTAAVMETSSAYVPPDKRSPNIRTVKAPDPYRDRAGRSDEELTTAYAEEVRRAIESFARDGVRFAGLLYCSAFSSEGLADVPTSYLAKALQHVRAAGGVFIADEVQAGFGRTGHHMWAYQRYGVVPDLVTLGKPMGNGHPMGGVVVRPELMEVFTARHRYFNTFAGNPVSAAVGAAVLDVLERERLLTNAAATGRYTVDALAALARKHSIIGDVRGLGMFFAVELVRDPRSKAPAADETLRLINRVREHGVLISRIGPHGNILKIRPPMPFNREHADMLADAVDRGLTEL